MFLLQFRIQPDPFVLRSEAGACVRVHERVLRACGYWRRAGRRGDGAYRGAVLLLTGAYLAQECVFAYGARADLDRLARVMFLLLCHVTSLVKQLVLAFRAERVDAAVRALAHPLCARGGPEGARLRARTTATAERFVRAYAGTAVFTCTLWGVYPVLQRARHQRVDFPLWLPFEYQEGARFAAVLLYSYYVTALVGIANTTMDAFIATLLNQYKTQLAILRMELADVLGGSGRGAERGNGRDRLRACVRHYALICEQVRLLLDTFGGAILVQFAIGGWILCLAAYKMVSLKVASIEFASMALFISCILTELFLYCYYGNEVSVESALVADAAYGARWEGAGAAARRDLVLVMVRAQRPLVPSAARLVPLSLQTFLKIIKSSYTFYAVLRQTKET